ncbi:expressed unknown protein [Seminavis robusta]|uniref:Uncharacterized protein n=1 Tax=Seminavis robusta TaxID=568900 RepID=A0A9N8DN38_9STRA|nr:expressed unknown protein [Seminavis robusta]|eukprot:Sro170_g075290.1 n/a (173) ;mRNA; r:1243-1761
MFFEASLTVLCDPNPDPPEYETLRATGKMGEEARTAIAVALHEFFFSQPISDNEEDNMHDYTTPLGFLDCCRRGFEGDDFRPTANIMWDALRDAYGTLQVIQKEGDGDEGETAADNGANNSEQDNNTKAVEGQEAKSNAGVSKKRKADPDDIDKGDDAKEKSPKSAKIKTDK